ncbi:putative MATE family efflux protein [Sedimentibacter acidaminivorans]|uniref:Probable multidrug resistance protein NorM n=1 Tax=Sedimentibacter acidaminivorans TaxID=913099 RepID=A0ABS4G924_9FIRM|nr:MATE family efflux transporter [Sedimentibacter acidaminivorans]MBP1924191.1 putative MATE family efflux protein [Sedimentibacter acidaminivorans]
MNRRIDLLEGNIFTTLTKLAIPIMATSFIQMAYNMVDMIWIGKLGSGSVAATGVAGMYMWLSNGFTTLARMGGQVKVAHSLGAKKHEDARVFAKNSLQLCAFLGLLYALVMLLFTKPLIGFFNLTDNKVIYDANIYLRIISIGIVFAFLNQGMTGIITASGNSKTPFFANTVGLIINIILDPIFIFGFAKIPPMNVAGAALATVISQILVFILFLWYAQNDDLLFLGIKIFSKPDLTHMLTITKIGLPVAIQGTFFTTVSMFISRMVANWGDVAIAVQKVGSQIESISWMTSEGFASAVNSFVGQNYGANNYKRAKDGYKTSLVIISIWGIISTCLLVFIPKNLFTIFINEAEAIPYGIDYLVILGYSQLPMCIEIITAGAFAGFGKTMYPSMISVILTGLRLPLAAVLVYVGLGLNGIWWSITISSILKGAILILIFIVFIKKMDKENTILF